MEINIKGSSTTGRLEADLSIQDALGLKTGIPTKLRDGLRLTISTPTGDQVIYISLEDAKRLAKAI